MNISTAHNIEHIGGIIKNDESKYAALKSVDLGSVRWTTDFWAERFNQCKDVTLKHLYDLMNDPNTGHSLTNLKIAAGMEKGEFAGTHWQDEWVYKWLEAASYIYVVTKEEALNKRMDEIIEIIRKAQQSDGYIATQITVRGLERFKNNRHHELYVMGHLLTAACSHYRATRKRSFLDIAIKTGNYLYNKFIMHDVELAHMQFNPSNIMGLVELYRTTGDIKYLDAAGAFIDMHASQPGGTDHTQDRVALRDENEIVGHSVCSTYLYCGAADYYMETGDETLLSALDRIWNNLVEKKMYIHGGIGALHRGYSIRLDKESERYIFLDDVHEAAGGEYELPKSTAYNETCAQIGNFMWNWRMLSICGEVCYSNIMELSLYNSILSGIDLEGMNWFYTNPIRWYGTDHRLLSSDAYQRFKPGRRKICCPSNLLRTIAGLNNYMYSVSEKGIYVHLYGSNEFDGNLIDGSRLKFVQSTDYPWEGLIKLKITEAPLKKFAFLFRIPEWSKNAEIRISGIDSGIVAKTDSYAVVERIWKSGDVIELNLQMRVRQIQGNPKIESVENQVAVMRGPILYCVESFDLPRGVKIEDICLTEETELSARFDNKLLNGVMLLEGEALVFKHKNWNGKLYRELEVSEPQKIKIRLIPYFAWCNRGIGEMAVWLPLR